MVSPVKVTSLYIEIQGSNVRDHNIKAHLNWLPAGLRSRRNWRAIPPAGIGSCRNWQAIPLFAILLGINFTVTVEKIISAH